MVMMKMMKMNLQWLFLPLICLFSLVVKAEASSLHENQTDQTEVIQAKVKYFDLQDVRLLDSPFKNAMDLNAAWMLEMDLDRLLSNFLTNAGLKPKAEPYGSWEAMGIAGHTLGHYLGAVSQQYASTGDLRFKVKVDYIVNILDSCQKNFVNGFIGGMPGGDKVFKEVKSGIIRSAGFDLNGIWVPWYNEHKTMMGLNDAYLLTGNSKALSVLVKLSDYLIDAIAPLSDEQMQQMLNCEFGGMNEAFAQVYALTGDKKYLDASYRFYHKRIMDKLAEGVDVLPGLHSNTQIPKIIGSALQYELTGNDRDRKIADYFWYTMVHNHSYANGGNSSGEYLSTAGKLNDRLTHSTCETCNTYNMLKLSQYLFEWTANAEYADYYEKALYNHILSSQHPQTGMTCYFVPLAMGTQKEFCDKFNSFTCCMGSGFENHSKYGRAIYAYGTDDASLYLNLYIPSVLDWKSKKTQIRMETAYPENGKVTLTINSDSPVPYTINVRYPAWATNGMALKVNGLHQKIAAMPGSFAGIKRTWKNGDKIEIIIPMSLHTEAIPDNVDRRALLYGPVLLAGALGTKHRETGDIPAFISSDKQIVKYIRSVKNKPLTFKSHSLGVPDDVTFIPFYNTYDQYYSVYWDVYSPAEWAKNQDKRQAEMQRLAKLNSRTLDYIVLGEMQPERDHNLRSENSRNGDFRNRKYRFAYENGMFDFDMKVGSSDPVQLLMTYWGGDSGKSTFELVINDTYVVPVTISGDPESFVEAVVDLPQELTRDKEKIKVKFRGVGRNRVSNLYNCRLMKRP